jgi:DNA replication protein DnaC
MNAGMKALLIENLKKLKLSTMIRNLEGLIRQANQEKLSYEEFLLNLSEAEVRNREENGHKRRLREANFPILKPMETFNLDAAPELDVRLMKELSNCDYVKKNRNIIFMGKSGTGNYVKLLLM